MNIPLISLLHSRSIGGPDLALRCAKDRYEVRPARNASRTESHLNQTIPAKKSQTMPANSMNRISRGFSVLGSSIGPNQNAANARTNTIAVAMILVITVNLRRKTVRFTTPQI